MSLTDGDKMSQARARRLQSSIPASYTVYLDDTTYRAEANTSGGTDYSGTNATTIIQNAIDALSSGGVVFLRNATYEIPSAIDLADNIILVGEGYNTVLKATANATIINVSGTSGNYVTDWAVENLRISGDSRTYTGPGIYTTYVNRFNLKNLWVFNIDGYGLDFETDTWDGYIEKVLAYECGNVAGTKAAVELDGSTNNNRFNILHLEQFYYYGLNLNNASCFNNVFTECKFHGFDTKEDYPLMRTVGTYNFWIGCTFEYCGSGVSAVNVGGITNKIDTCRISDVDNDAIGLSGYRCTVKNTTIDAVGSIGINCSGTRNVIEGNPISNVTVHGIQQTGDTSSICSNILDTVTQTGIRITGDTNVAKNNELISCGTPMSDTGTGNILKDNPGYVTEAAGTSAGTGATQNIAHGMDVTPAYLLLGDIDQGASPYRTSGANATYIFVSAASAKNYTWRAWKYNG